MDDDREHVSLLKLIRIIVEGPPLSEWDPSSSVDLWLKDKIRRVNRPKAGTSISRSESGHASLTNYDEDTQFSLNEWEDWILKT